MRTGEREHFVTVLWPREGPCRSLLGQGTALSLVPRACLPRTDRAVRGHRGVSAPAPRCSSMGEGTLAPAEIQLPGGRVSVCFVPWGLPSAYTVPGTEHAPGPSPKGSEEASTPSSVTSPEQAPELPRGGPRPPVQREAVSPSPPPSLDHPPESGDREIHLSQGPGGHLRPEPWTPAVAVGPSPDPSWPVATKAGRARGFAAQLRPRD